MKATLKKWLSKNKRHVLGALLGAAAGFLYWRLVGCSSGSCAITSDPLVSTLYFALIGLLLAGTFSGTKKAHGNQQKAE